MSGRERSRSVSCSSPTVGGSISLRSTSRAEGLSSGLAAINQRTNLATWQPNATCQPSSQHLCYLMRSCGQHVSSANDAAKSLASHMSYVTTTSIKHCSHAEGNTSNSTRSRSSLHYEWKLGLKAIISCHICFMPVKYGQIGLFGGVPGDSPDQQKSSTHQ